MAKTKKTMNVEELREHANNLLRSNAGDSNYREGVISTIEYVLHYTGNYNGFNYLFEADVPAGCKPGIRSIPGQPYIAPDDYDSKFVDTDGTRRRYY